ncbi:hypothetical protein AB6A40_009256 [Gnathostoma spinigerum]|uniref:Uncharacterized protein n=1 Tax=Gnathostoma spinigerum TaxID=75299 RepID=A0ABD6F0A8_9BILA
MTDVHVETENLGNGEDTPENIEAGIPMTEVRLGTKNHEDTLGVTGMYGMMKDGQHTRRYPSRTDTGVRRWEAKDFAARLVNCSEVDQKLSNMWSNKAYVSG